MWRGIDWIEHSGEEGVGLRRHVRVGRRIKDGRGEEEEASGWRLVLMMVGQVWRGV